MVINPEFEILKQSVRLDDPGDTILETERIIKTNQIDWDDLYYRADIHSVRPQLAKLISKVDPVLVPDNFREKLNDAYQKNLYDQLSYSAEFLNIRKFLEEENIPAIPFKGFWLAQSMYGNLANREATDVDMFIHLKDIERIKIVMLNNGYQADNFFLPFTFEEIKKKFGEYNFEKIEDGVKKFHFEFHWQISSPVYGMGISYDDLKSQVVTGKIENHEFPVYSSSANLLLAVMHHGGKDPFLELKQVLDIAMIVNKDKNLDWEWVKGTARRFNAENLIYIAVKLASDLTGVGIPEIVCKRTLSWKTRNLVNNRIRFMLKSPYYWHRWIMLNEWLFRIRSRTGMKLKIRLAAYITGHVLLRYLAPAKVRKKVLRIK